MLRASLSEKSGYVYVFVVRVMESKYGDYIGLWRLWQPFKKWQT